MKNMSIT